MSTKSRVPAPILLAALMGCRLDYMYDRIEIGGVERWGLATVNGTLRTFAVSESDSLECYYRWRIEGTQHLDLEPCPSCLITWSVVYEPDQSYSDSSCPENEEVWPNEYAFLGVAALTNPNEPNCQLSAHYEDPELVMDDPKAHLDELALVGVGQSHDWNSQCYLLGNIRLGIDKYSDDLIGSFEYEYQTEYWQLVDLNGSIRATNQGS